MADWFVGITTAPRPHGSLLASTAKSLSGAGWNHPVAFAEPESDVGDCEAVLNPSRLGAWGNFLQAVRHAVDSGAERIAVVQDDIQCAIGLREYLDNTLRDGWHSPYCPGYAAEFIRGGWMAVPAAHIHREHGGCFFACTRETAARFLKTLPRDTGINGTDRWVTKWSRRTKTPLWYHSPSLVQHVGVQSTIHLKKRSATDPDVPLCWMRQATNYCNDVRSLDVLRNSVELEATIPPADDLRIAEEDGAVR